MMRARLCDHRRRIRALALLVTGLALAACARGGARSGAIEPSAPDPASLRSTTSGRVVGGSGAYGSHVWLGIPFAAPPVDELRWRAPRPHPGWDGERQTIRRGSPCPQYASGMGGVSDVKRGTATGKEDCLFLNVWTPKFSAGAVPSGGARLPVMLWIHGGGNTIGHAGFYEAGHLAVSQNVMVVTTSYRIGPFGFFRLAATRDGAESEAEASGNFALLDLVRALEWVRDNAESFGGDPGRVTIFGESAGGQNVYALLLAPQARGLFHRAIAQSGAMRWTQPDVAEGLPGAASAPNDARTPRAVVASLLVRDGRAKDVASAASIIDSMPAAELASWLRARSTDEILGAYRPMPSGMISMPTIVQDGTVVPAGSSLERFATTDGWNRVPVVAGTNRDENKLFLFFEPALVKRWFGIVPRLIDEPLYLAQADVLSRAWKVRGADEPASAMRHVQDDVFVYRFDWDEQPSLLGADLAKLVGAAHGLEIPFVFGHFDLGREGNVMFTDENEPGRQELSRVMSSYWGALARDGRPGRGTGGDLPEWTPWDASPADAPRTMVLDTPAGGGPRMTADRELRAELLASVEQDERLDSVRARCEVYVSLVRFSDLLTRDAYASVANGACAELPFDQHPWEDRR